jgi:hypothetical protein
VTKSSNHKLSFHRPISIFFSYQLPVVISYRQLNCCVPLYSHSLDCTSWVWVLYYERMVSRSVCLGIKHPSNAYDQISITVRQGRVCRLQLLLVLASAVILGTEFHATPDHILQPQIRYFHVRRLLRLAGLRWRYSTPPPHGILTHCTGYKQTRVIWPPHGPTHRKHSFLYAACCLCCGYHVIAT